MSSSGRGKKSGNPWHNSRGGKLKHKTRTDNHVSNNKFREAQVKLQTAVEKYAKDYESSSSEDELESDNLIGSLLKNYAEIGGNKELLGRTQAFLEDNLVSGAATCLICISSIKRIEKIWNCVSCFGFFHLQCIERWSKDSVVQQKEFLVDLQEVQKIPQIKWGCPKCRFDYEQDDIPRDYYCFCRKARNPPVQPWLVPHSCGDLCGKQLQPLCGHGCTLLCHPGPCPPCPKTVTISCFCKAKPPKLQRCSKKEWSCGSPCKKLLECALHFCLKPCHPGNCPPCTKRSKQKCNCGANEELRDCSTPNWQCKKICAKALACGNHSCPLVCHAGACDVCELTKPRRCPCGKSRYELPCDQDTPTCGDTCGKLLECGAHACNQRCHKDKCGTCLEIVVKWCRCGLHEKEIQCKKVFLCETKCKKIRDCNKHSCNRKCCDGSCPPCEKPCGRTLTCGIHKCTSVCHRGPCYPCPLETSVKCRCSATQIIVPCGGRKRTKPPRCLKLCKIPPSCLHNQQELHRCHFGDCPPCKQICGQRFETCSHKCPVPCHSNVLCKIETEKASMPWELKQETERKCLPCPPCKELVPVTCYGAHETVQWPCHDARPGPCFKPCGRLLLCGNHRCSLICHPVENAINDVFAGTNCEPCENPCTIARPAGCNHSCPKPCHGGNCPPCKVMIRLRCHCGLNQPYVQCFDWTSADDTEKVALQSCGNQCPKYYECGHRCKTPCHPADCPNPEQCKKKVKIHCPCRRIKKDITCELLRTSPHTIQCDDICNARQIENQKLKEIEEAARQAEEDERNAKEVEKFEKKFQGKKKYKDRKRTDEPNEENLLQKYWMFIIAFVLIVGTILLFKKM